jgi:hypothetical protein
MKRQEGGARGASPEALTIQGETIMTQMMSSIGSALLAQPAGHARGIAIAQKAVGFAIVVGGFAAIAAHLLQRAIGG